MQNFQQNPVLQQQLLAQLAVKRLDPALWEKNLLSWNGTKGSMVGHILGSADLAQWEQLGLPKWLALCVDYFYLHANSLDAGIDAGIALLSKIHPQRDLSILGSQYLLELLSNAEYGLQKLALPTALAEGLQHIVAVHQQCIAGIAVEASSWRQLRKTLVQLTNQYAEESLHHRIGACLEAAAWDPASSRSVIADTVRAWIALQTLLVVEQSWSEEDDQQIRQLLKRLHDAAMQDKPADTSIDVFALLEQHYPDYARRLREHIARKNQQTTFFGQQAYTQLLALLSMEPAQPCI